MRLAKFRAGYPVFVVESEVTIQSPRVPTVFEKMVLRLLKQAERHDAVARFSMRNAFEEMLGVADAPLMLASCLDDLVVLDMVRAPAVDEPIEAPLGDWQLTATGREFWQRGLLPGRPTLEKVRHCIDAIGGAVAPLKEGAAPGMPQSPPVALQASFPDIDLRPQIAVSLPQERHGWWRPSTELMEVRSRHVETRWLAVDLQLDCAVDGTLELHAPSDAGFERWLQQARADVVWDHLLAPTLNTGAASVVSSAAPLSLADVASLAPRADVAGAGDMRGQERPGPMFIVSMEDGRERPLAVQGAADRVRLSPTAELLQIFTQPEKGAAVDEPDGGMSLALPLPAQLPAGFQYLEIARAGAAPQVTVEGVVALFWKGQRRMVPVRAGLLPARSAAVWEAIRFRAESWLVSQAQPHQVVLAAWFETPEFVVTRWAKRVAGLGPLEWFAELARVLAGLQQRLRIAGPLDRQPWAGAVLEACAQQIHGIGNLLSLHDGLALLAAMKPLSLKLAPLAERLMQRLPPAGSMDELLLLREALGNGQAVLPANVLSERVRNELLALAINGKAAPCGPHAFVRPVQAFADVYQRSRRDLPPVLLEQAVESSEAWLKTIRAQPVRILSAVEQLEQAVRLTSVKMGCPEDELLGALQPLAGRLSGLRHWLDRALAPRLPPGQRAVVIDTNSLIDHPDLLSRMPTSDIPFIPKRVLEELDRLKQLKQPEAAEAAERARKAVNSLLHAASRVQYEGSKLALCATDWEETPDNEILSLAVYLSLSPVLLLTSDKPLLAKAGAESMQALPPGKYLQQAPQRGTRPSATARPTPVRSAI